MRSDWFAPLARDAKRDPSVTLYHGATWEEVILGTATGGLDLAPYATRVSHRAAEGTVELSWNRELYGASQPVPGDIVSLGDAGSGQVFWNGYVEQVSDYRESRGERAMTLGLRRRDASPLWRENRWATDVYPLGTDLFYIARDVARSLGLGPSEVVDAPSGYFTPHASTQLSDLTAWDMLTTIGLPCGYDPFVDALGRFGWTSRDVTRDAALALEAYQLVSIQGGRSRPPVSTLSLKWLDPALVKSVQQSQVLATEVIAAGFFRLSEGRTVYFSDDRRQRAQHTYMVVKQSINSGLIPFGTESYAEADDQFSGRIAVANTMYVQALATASIATMLAGHKIPDKVQVGPSGTGVTIPVGRIVEGAAHAALFLALMCLGTGTYEIWGQPYDYVHAVNRTEAYDDGAEAWATSVEEIQNDYIENEAHAQTVAARELLYRSLAAQSWSFATVDLPGLEPGDIVELPDESRVYATDYTRDLTRGAPAVLQVEGFRC